MRLAPLLISMVIAAGMLSSPPSSLSDDDVNLAGAWQRVHRIEALRKEMETLHRELLVEERDTLKTLRKCEEHLDRFFQTPLETRTREETKNALSMDMLKTRTIGLIRGHKGMDYIYDNLFFYSAGPHRNQPGLFVGFPCADFLSRTEELHAVRAVIRQAHGSELTEGEKVFCARLLYKAARNPDRKNALGRNLLLKEVEDLTARIETRKKANAPSWAIRPLERDLENLDRNVQGILICYDHILENDNLAMQEFSAVIADMGKLSRMKWGTTE